MRSHFSKDSVDVLRLSNGTRVEAVRRDAAASFLSQSSKKSSTTEVKTVCRLPLNANIKVARVTNMDAGMMNGLEASETPGAAAVLGGENSYVRPDPSIWNKDLLSRSDIMQEDVCFDQHIWMYNTPDIAWLTQGLYYEEHLDNSS